MHYSAIWNSLCISYGALIPVVSIPWRALWLQHAHRHDNPERPQGSRSVGSTHQDSRSPLTAVLDRPSTSTSDSLVNRMWPLTRPTTSWIPPNFRIVLYFIKVRWTLHISSLFNSTLSLTIMTEYVKICKPIIISLQKAAIITTGAENF